MSEQVPGGGIELSPAEIEALDARWSSCWAPGEVARYLVRPKDQADFDGTIPHMTPVQRATLASLLARVHPGHRWLAGL